MPRNCSDSIGAPAKVTHSQVSALPELLQPGDLLIVNDTRVIPARLFGRGASGGAVELLLIRPSPPTPGGETWLCLGKPARRLRIGATLTIAGSVRATVAAVHRQGRYDVTFETPAGVRALLEQHGEIPLPPYIRRPDGPLPLRSRPLPDDLCGGAGAIAAPTAGLHFTPAHRGAERPRDRYRRTDTARWPRNVLAGAQRRRPPARDGPGVVRDPTATAAAIHDAKAGGRRVVAVGTTTTRALESAAEPMAASSPVHAGPIASLSRGIASASSTRCSRTSTCPARRCCCWSAPSPGVSDSAAYTEAIRRRYRFYSYGDAMLIQ